MIDFTMPLGFMDDAPVVAVAVRVGRHRGVVLSAPASERIAPASNP